MKTFSTSIIILFMSSLMACNDEQRRKTDPNSDQQTTSSENFKEGEDYQLFTRVRIMDNAGFTEPAEAFSILLPKGWKEQGEVVWSRPGSGCDGTNYQFRASSADGKYSIEYYPVTTWAWTSDQQLRAMQAQLPKSSPYCSYGDPMNAEQYLRNQFAAELGASQVVSLEQTPEAIAELRQSGEKARNELMSYGASDVRTDASAVRAKLQWQDNTEAIVLLGISQMMVTVPNMYTGTSSQQVTTMAQKRIVFRYPAGEEAEASKLMAMIVGSYRTNPYWQDEVNNYWRNVRQQKHTAHVGKIKMMDAQTRAIGAAAIQKGNDRLAQMDVEMRNWEAKQQSGDRIHTEFIKTIRGVENYQDAGSKVELSSGYNHAWSRGDGSNFIMTNNSNFDPSSVFQDQAWKEMKKVD